jgi:hypothetical protein
MFRPFSNLTRSANAVHRNLNFTQTQTWRRAQLFFTFGDHQDQIIALGARDYPPTAGEFDAGQPVERATLGWDRQVHRSSWPVDQYAECQWFVYTGVHTAEVMRIEARRIGATAPGNRVGTEPNCLGHDKSIHLLIGVRF